MRTDVRGTESIADVEALEAALSEPTAEVVELFGRLEGDLVILGVGGKMGPTLARMAQRATTLAGRARRIIGVSRFGQGDLAARLRSWGVETIACDLLDVEQLNKLPDAPNVVYMAGMKFGATGNEGMTWAMNAWLPAMVARRYRHSRIAAFSTGNLYGLSAVTRGGSIETDALAPAGEYAMSCLGRERMLEHFSRVQGTKLSLIRLNYACELRYGVLVDLAGRVWAGKPVDLAMGCFNVIWQGDANAMALRSLEHADSPPFVVNVAGPEMLSCRRVCEEFGRLMGKTPAFVGEESAGALLSNGQLGHRLWGYPRVSAGQMMRWIADWVKRGGASLNKPTHFEVRDGKF